MSRIQISTALILCAGYGTRLRPISDILPKPLLPVRGKPLLISILDRLLKAGINRAFVNVCHLGDTFADELSKILGTPHFDENLSLDFFKFGDGRVYIIREDKQILDTGGAVKNASRYLNADEPILVHNGDIFYDADMSEIVFQAQNVLEKSSTVAALVLRDGGQNPNVGVRGANVVDMRFTTKAACEKLAQFTGVFVASARFVKAASAYPEDVFSTVDLLLRFIEKSPDSVAAVFQNNVEWSDIGTPGAYLACADAKKYPTNYGRLAELCLRGFFPRNAEFINKGASTRSFIRFEDPKFGKLVACFYPEQKREDFLYANIAKFLKNCGVSVPELVQNDELSRITIMHDAGNTDLLTLKNDGKDCRPQYLSLMLELKKIHTRATKKWKESPFELSPCFDKKLYDWEQDYFFENCIKNRFRIDIARPQDEFDKITDTLLAASQTLLHRDAQSQNVMLDTDGNISLIDFQGMRFGCAMYDVASVLFDPYVELSESEREEYFSHYLGAYKCPKEYSDALKLLYIAAVERLMQSLGAYGFLSIKRGMTVYEKYFKPALKNLAYCAGKADLKKIGYAAAECLRRL